MNEYYLIYDRETDQLYEANKYRDVHLCPALGFYLHITRKMVDISYGNYVYPPELDLHPHNPDYTKRFMLLGSFDE